MSTPTLGYPDPKLPYILDRDVSAVGVGAVLSQVQEGKETVIAYYSKTLAPLRVNIALPPGVVSCNKGNEAYLTLPL